MHPLKTPPTSLSDAGIGIRHWGHVSGSDGTSCFMFVRAGLHAIRMVRLCLKVWVVHVLQDVLEQCQHSTGMSFANFDLVRLGSRGF